MSNVAVSLFNLKAAVVLAMNATPDAIIWWDGIVKNQQGQHVVVLQVDPAVFTKARKVLHGHKIKPAKIVEGNPDYLLPIPIEQLVHDLPKPAARTWVVDHDSPHAAWKDSVVTQLDSLGIRHLKMEYSGAGDSANDDDWTTSRLGVANKHWYPKQHDEEGNFWWKAQYYEIPKPLTEEISNYVWETLVQYDCVNNDGGGGDITFDLSDDEPVILFNCYTNEMVRTEQVSDEEI